MENLFFWLLVVLISCVAGYLYYKIVIKIIFGKLTKDFERLLND